MRFTDEDNNNSEDEIQLDHKMIKDLLSNLFGHVKIFINNTVLDIDKNIETAEKQRSELIFSLNESLDMLSSILINNYGEV
jgi:small nuclear ribonucleoprotein (snRNP)-like protein